VANETLRMFVCVYNSSYKEMYVCAINIEQKATREYFLQSPSNPFLLVKEMGTRLKNAIVLKCGFTVAKNAIIPLGFPLSASATTLALLR